jgi:hypothetical protein
VLIDVTNDSPQFAALAGLARRGGTAVTIRFVADQQALARAGVTEVNFEVPMSVRCWTGWQRP